MNTTVAQTILEQLGGHKFVVMTGARHLSAHPDALSFKLPSNFAKDGINYVKITLDPTDTYSICFDRIRGLNIVSFQSHSGIYADQLKALFTEVTGLEVSL